MTRNVTSDPTGRRRFLQRCVAGGAAWALTGGVAAGLTGRVAQAATAGPSAAAGQYSAADAAALRASQLVTPATAAATAGDEAYWRRVRQFYPMPESIIHLEHGNWGMMSHTVLAHYEQQLARVNHYTSYYGRQDFGGEEAAIMQQLADWLAVDPAELVLVRNATEALTSLSRVTTA